MRNILLYLGCLFLCLSCENSSAQMSELIKKHREKSFYNEWRVITSYTDGSDTLLYCEGLSLNTRLSGWENSLAISNEQVSLIVDAQEQTLMLFPKIKQNKKINNPVVLADSILNFLVPTEDSSQTTVTDSLITVEQSDAQISIHLNPQDGFVDEIKIVYKNDASQEEKQNAAIWQLSSHSTDSAVVKAKIDISRYLNKEGNQWVPTPAYSHFEFINLINNSND